MFRTLGRAGRAAVQGERKLLAESGQLSGAALTRYRELDKRQGELSAALAGGDAASSPRRAGRF